MSLEAAIIAHTEALLANTAVVARNNELAEQIVAGRADAIAAIKDQTAEAAKPATRSRKAAAETPPATETPATTTPAVTETAATVTTAAPAATTPAPAPVSIDDLRKAFGGYLEAATTPEARKERAEAIVKPILTHFAVAKITDLSADQAVQAMFFLKRHEAGIAIDYNADYDFAGDPTQGGADMAGPAEDEFGL